MKKIVSIYHYMWAFLGNIIYGFPSKKIFIVGVTGTKGKSTSLEIMSAIFESAGYKTAVLSSVTRKIGKKIEKNKTGNSMPGRMIIQKFLRDAVRAGCTHAFIEVTSQGVVQHRHKYIDWNSACFTNLSPEHIESHGSYDAYREAKKSFFSYVARSPKKKRWFFINKEDKEAEVFAEVVRHYYANTTEFFSKTNFLRWISDFVDITSEHAQEKFNKWIFADFNLENCALATHVALSQHIKPDVIIEALKTFKGVSGRLEVVQNKPFVAIIDYAHTPESLEKVYSVAKKEYAKSPTNALIAVLGAAGGGRDVWKRKEFGKIAAQYCDHIVLTNEDPFDEDQYKIIENIKQGLIEKNFPTQNIHIELDRRKAIRLAISFAKHGDVVIGTGKGSEEWIRWENGKKEAWNEKKAFEEELEKKQTHH